MHLPLANNHLQVNHHHSLVNPAPKEPKTLVPVYLARPLLPKTKVYSDKWEVLIQHLASDNNQCHLLLLSNQLDLSLENQSNQLSQVLEMASLVGNE